MKVTILLASACATLLTLVTSNVYAQPAPNVLRVTVYNTVLPRQLHQDVPIELCPVQNAWIEEYYEGGENGKLLERRYMGCDFRPGLLGHKEEAAKRRLASAFLDAWEAAIKNGTAGSAFTNGFDGTCRVNMACRIPPKKD